MGARPGQWFICAFVGFVCLLTGLQQTASAKKPKKRDVDKTLRNALRAAGVRPLDVGPDHGTAQVDLGRFLFFDKELSGNRDVACATCHHPLFFSGDGLSVSIGVGGLGLGPGLQPDVFPRLLGSDREFIPRMRPTYSIGVPCYGDLSSGIAGWKFRDTVD